MDAIDKLHGIRYVLNNAKNDLISLRNIYKDDRGNLDEAERFISDALLNIEGHIKDIYSGVE